MSQTLYVFQDRTANRVVRVASAAADPSSIFDSVGLQEVAQTFPGGYPLDAVAEQIRGIVGLMRQTSLGDIVYYKLTVNDLSASDFNALMGI